MTAFLLLTPFFLVFEVGQLVMAERYLGIKQIARNGDPRLLGLGEFTAFCWSSLILSYWLWMVAMLTVPMARIHALCLLAVSLLGYALRRNTGIKWMLVILTFEGAVRVGLLLPLIVLAWRHF